MSIADVTRLKQLRNRLYRFVWHGGSNLDSIEFTLKHDGCHEHQTFSDQEKEDLKNMLEIERSVKSWSLSERVGDAVKTIVLNRIDFAIKKAARDAAAEAREVLGILEGGK